METKRESMIDNGNGTVTDEATGLMWQQETPENKMVWEQATSYCEALNLAGFADWRLPTLKELQSLVDYSRYNPAVSTTYFPDTAASWYWSSTTYAGNTTSAWLVNFYSGSVNTNYKNDSNYVRAVRGEEK